MRTVLIILPIHLYLVAAVGSMLTLLCGQAGVEGEVWGHLNVPIVVRHKCIQVLP